MTPIAETIPTSTEMIARILRDNISLFLGRQPLSPSSDFFTVMPVTTISLQRAILQMRPLSYLVVT